LSVLCSGPDWWSSPTPDDVKSLFSPPHSSCFQTCQLLGIKRCKIKICTMMMYSKQNCIIPPKKKRKYRTLLCILCPPITTNSTMIDNWQASVLD
jgi:hypothetical protein